MPNGTETPPIIAKRYYPTLSSVITKDDIPEVLGFLKEGLENLLEKIHYKDLQYSKSPTGDAAFYSLSIVSPNRIDLEIPGTGIFIVLNPDLTAGGDQTISAFPITIEYEWKILAYLRAFSVGNFSFTPQEIFEVALRVLNISEEQAIANFINTFVVSEEEGRLPIQQFVIDINDATDLNLPVPTENTTLTELAKQMFTQSGGQYASIIALGAYVAQDPEQALDKLKIFFRSFIPSNIDEFIKDILIPKFRATLTLIAGLEFPRTMLVPVYPEGTEIGETDVSYEPIPEPAKAMFTFAEALFYADTEQGLGYDMELVINTVTPVQIGKTGIILNINNLKIDLSTKTNFPEADTDGRPPEFIGVYTEQTDIILPKKWFKKIAGPEQTLKISGEKLLIGTGGISGTIALEAFDPNIEPTEDDYFNVLLGRDVEKAWKLGFNKFDIRFNQGAVVESNLRAKLFIPKFKLPNSTEEGIEIGVEGHLNEEGDFDLTASVAGGIEANLFDFVTFNFLSLSLGKDDNNYYIGTSCEIWFQSELMQKILGEQKIQIPKIRVYTDGSIEFVGGNSFIPTNLSLDLGPINVAVTGIHFGSHEQNGRKYNYWGFDGAISLNPLGIDARGEGIKFYYTVDEGPKDSFFRIQTIEVDLVIPGSATPESALAIIHGMLSIPQPGESQEYYGEIDINLPQLKVSGGAAMKLQPKHPAFIIDAYVNLPGPIPIGPVGIYGFRGLMGFRYVAEKEAIGMASEGSWYDYYVYPPKGIDVTKFTGPERSKDYDPAFSLGVGATLGTSFDNGMIVSLRAMVLFSFPTAIILDFGLTFISKRLGLIEDDPRNPPFFAFIALGDNSLEFGLGADFQLPDNGSILDLQARIEAGFFFKNQKPWYVNFGTRETPVTATLFKDVLNITVTSYLMISAQGIEAGARAQLILDENFVGIKVHLSAYIEVGGHVSFKRPQTGGYMLAGGKVRADIWGIVVVEVALDTVFSVEAIKPFLLYAALQLRVRIKLLFIKIRIDVKLELKWEKVKTVNRDPFSRLPIANEHQDVGVESDRTKELVKGVHMLTNETFDLQYIEPDTSQNDNYYVDPNQIIKVIPMDTFIDIKTVKGLDPSVISINGKIGGHTGGADGFKDLIPPQKVVKGKELRQVTHKHSIEEITIKIHNGETWVDYNPFEAIVEEEIQLPDLRFGYWQRTGKQYDHLRILATTPFSFISSGQPGWFIPEEYGITGAELFCVEESLLSECSDFLNKQIGEKYYIPADIGASHYIDGAYYVLDGENIIMVNDDGSTYLLNEEYFEIAPALNPHGFSQSLSFKNYNKLWIILPEPSVSVKLKLSTESSKVKISYFSANIPGVNSSHTGYVLIGNPVNYTGSALHSEIEFSTEGQLISRILIEPEAGDIDAINEVREQIQEYINNGYETGTINNPNFYNTPEYLDLIGLLNKLRSGGCASNNNLSDDDKKRICAAYNEFLNRYWNCLKAPIEFRDREHPSGPYIRQAQHVIDSLPCYNSLLLYMQSFASDLDNGLYFTDFISNYQIKLSELQLICNTVINDGEISHPADTTLIMTKHSEFIAVYEQFLDKLRTLKVCDTVTAACTKTNQLETALASCLSASPITFINCYQTFRTELNTFLTGYNEFRNVLTYLLDEQSKYFTYYATSIIDLNTVRSMLSENAQNIFSTLRDLANCNTSQSDNDNFTCSTSVQQVCWMSLERHEYNETIPGQSAVMADQEDMENGILNHVQPIWRPNSKFYIHFKLKDSIDNGNTQGGEYNYYYGFRTVGPVGYYHRHPDAHYIPDGEKADSYALSSLRNYIDYNRSYPNADSNLLKSKPLFYENDQCKISLFFKHPYVYHMLKDWKPYKGLSQIKGSINIAIKDPVTNIVVPYPLPVDYVEDDTVPVPVGSDEGNAWVDDHDPRLPLEIQALQQYVENINENEGAIQCELVLGEMIKPKAYAYSVKLTNLKPQKLYTAIVYNAFDYNGNGEIDLIPPLPNDPFDLNNSYENKQIHEFVFQTSRYGTFEQQVQSYLLTSESDESEQMQAVYDIALDLSFDDIELAYRLASNESGVVELQNQYLDYFDRLLEGVFGIPPLDAAAHTEFNKIIDTNTNDVIAILIRNTEPFNDPKIPLDYIQDMISVIGLGYTVLYSKDYSQAIIMHSSRKISESNLDFKFKYFVWDWDEVTKTYTYIEKSDSIASQIVINQ